MVESVHLVQITSSFYQIRDSDWFRTLLRSHIFLHHRQKYGLRNFDKVKFKGGKQICCYTGLSLNKGTCEASESIILNVQTLRRFPKEKLKGEVVLVRLDSNLLHRTFDFNDQSGWLAISTVKYLHDLGAKVLLVSNWGKSAESSIPTKVMADHLSSVLQLKVAPMSIFSGLNKADVEKMDEASVILLENLTSFKQETANSLDFAKRLSTNVSIFVNDAFSVSHKVLASTVGVTRFCYASLAGFKFEEELSCILEVAEITGQPYFAIIGGDNFSDKSKALFHLASKCDGLVFIGRIALQIMHALRHSDSLSAVSEILHLVQLAKDRKIPIFLPSDFLCMKDQLPEHLDIFPSDRLPAGWMPVGLGPRTLEEIFSMLSACKKILWIGPVEFCDSRKKLSGESELASMLEKLSRSGCHVVIVGSAACNAIAKTGGSSSSYKQFTNASSVWDFLKGKPLPGLAALDRAYPFSIDWNGIFVNRMQPLIVDIGSGNGLFLLKMSKRWKHLNFLGLDSNKKLVHRCLDYVVHHKIKNMHFVAANATHTFRSIISSYPGELILVAVQCPNPDFNNAQNRWRMVRRALVEAIEDLLVNGGKVFLQSDVEEVATRMKDEFIMYGKNLIVDKSYGEGWIKENPFGIRSDWERHVLDRGAPMYRTMLQKTGDSGNNLSKILHLICTAQAEN